MKSKVEIPEDTDLRPMADDPILMMLGVGCWLWEGEPGDRFVERLRSEDPPDPPAATPSAGSAGSLKDEIWRRIGELQGEEFLTARGLPFTYEVEGAGLWFFRDGRRINRKLTRKQLDAAVSRCPLSSTTEIKDLIDYAYVYGVLTDPRIKREAW